MDNLNFKSGKGKNRREIPSDVLKKSKHLYIEIIRVIIALSIFCLAPFPAFATCIYGIGVYGEGVYGGDCTGVTPSSGAGDNFWSVPVYVTNDSISECKSTQQVHNGFCYDCDPTTSFISWLNESTGYCNTCNPGYIIYDNACVKTSEFTSKVKSSVTNFSSFLLVILILLAYYWNRNRLSKKEKREIGTKDTEDDLEED